MDELKSARERCPERAPGNLRCWGSASHEGPHWWLRDDAGRVAPIVPDPERDRRLKAYRLRAHARVVGAFERFLTETYARPDEDPYAIFEECFPDGEAPPMPRTEGTSYPTVAHSGHYGVPTAGTCTCKPHKVARMNEGGWVDIIADTRSLATRTAASTRAWGPRLQLRTTAFRSCRASRSASAIIRAAARCSARFITRRSTGRRPNSAGGTAMRDPMNTHVGRTVFLGLILAFMVGWAARTAWEAWPWIQPIETLATIAMLLIITRWLVGKVD